MFRNFILAAVFCAAPSILFAEERYDNCTFDFGNSSVTWARINGSIAVDGYSGMDNILFGFLCQRNPGQIHYLTEQSTPYSGPWVFDVAVGNCTMDFRFSLDRGNGNVDMETYNGRCLSSGTSPAVLAACQSAVMSAGEDSGFASGYCRNADKTVAYWNCVQGQTSSGENIDYSRGYCD